MPRPTPGGLKFPEGRSRYKQLLLHSKSHHRKPQEQTRIPERTAPKVRFGNPINTATKIFILGCRFSLFNTAYQLCESTGSRTIKCTHYERNHEMNSDLFRYSVLQNQRAGTWQGSRNCIRTSRGQVYNLKNWSDGF